MAETEAPRVNPGPASAGVPVLHRDHATADGSVRDWEELRQSAEFRALVSAKSRFVVPATIFFLIFYLLLPLGIAFAPDLMRTNVAGHFTVAYAFAICQFLMTWVITYLYIHRAEVKFDGLAAAVRRRAGVNDPVQG